MHIVLSESPPVCEAYRHRITIVSFVKFHVLDFDQNLSTDYDFV